MRIIAGSLLESQEAYDDTPIRGIIGAIVLAIGVSYVPGAYCEEPMVTLFFDNGTKHSFVLPPQLELPE